MKASEKCVYFRYHDFDPLNGTVAVIYLLMFFIFSCANIQGICFKFEEVREFCELLKFAKFLNASNSREH